MASSELLINKEEKRVEFVFKIEKEIFDAAREKVYDKNKNKINVPGFRTGKAPRKIIENIYGKEIFYEDAINEVLPEEYQKAEEKFLNDEISVIGRPEFEIVNISEEGAEIKANLILRPEAEIENYKGLKYNKAKEDNLAISDEDVDNAIKIEQNKNARIITVERPAELGDSVNLNCQGYIDGKAFAAGRAENYDLVLGSKTFIDNFEEQLVGTKAGDDVEVNVVFPEKYHIGELSSKPAVFKVKINRVCKIELPELNDDFAQEVSEFDSFDEYRKNIRKKLEESKKNEIRDKALEPLLDILAQEVVVDVPKVMIDAVKENMLMNFERNLRNRGLDLKSYLTYANQTREGILESYNGEAMKQLRIRLALEAIARKENIEILDKDIEEEEKKMAEQTGMSVERLKGLLNRHERMDMRLDLKVQKAMDFIYENAIAVENNDDEGKNEVKEEIKEENEKVEEKDKDDVDGEN